MAACSAFGRRRLLRFGRSTIVPDSPTPAFRPVRSALPHAVTAGSIAHAPKPQPSARHRHHPGRRHGHAHEIGAAQGAARHRRPADAGAPDRDRRGGVRPHRRCYRARHGDAGNAGRSPSHHHPARTPRHRPRRPAGGRAVRHRRGCRTVCRQSADYTRQLGALARCAARTRCRAGADGDAPGRSRPLRPPGDRGTGGLPASSNGPMRARRNAPSGYATPARCAGPRTGWPRGCGRSGRTMRRASIT